MTKPAWKTDRIKIGVVRYDYENYQQWKVSLEGTVAEVFDAICDWSDLKVWIEEDYSLLDNSSERPPAEEKEK